MADRPAGSQDLPSARVTAGVDACMADLRKHMNTINTLHSQITDLHSQNAMLANQAGQVAAVEPEFKKMRMEIAENELNLLTVSERVRHQDEIYNHSLHKLQDQLYDQRADIRYLLKRTANTGNQCEESSEPKARR